MPTEARVRRYFLLALCALLAGCVADPVSLGIRSSAITADQQIARPVAFLHSPGFRNTLQTIEPYGNQYYLPIKIGEASDHALRAAYAGLFASVREVASSELLDALPERDAIALLQPTIERLDYLNASARLWGPYYAQVVYRFSLADTAGVRIADWRVYGFAEYNFDKEAREKREGAPRGETAMMIEAPRRAVEAAMSSFAASFARVPELWRWTRGLPLTGSDAPSKAQTLRTPDGPGESGVEAAYPGTFTLKINRIPLPLPPAPASERGKESDLEPALLALRIELRNHGTRRLALDPADVLLRPASGKPVETVPPPIVAAFVARRPFGMAVGVMSPGVGMLPALLGALVSASENIRHKEAFDQWATALQREALRDTIAPPGATIAGTIYLARPPRLEGATLTVPIIDLDDAVRYTVKAPLPEQ